MPKILPATFTPKPLNDPSALGPSGVSRIDTEIAAKLAADRLVAEAFDGLRRAEISAREAATTVILKKPVATVTGKGGYTPTQNGALPTDVVTVLVPNPKRGKSGARFAIYGEPGTSTSVDVLFRAIETTLGRTEALKLSADLEFDSERGLIAIERDGTAVDIRVSKAYRFEDKRGNRRAADVV